VTESEFVLKAPVGANKKKHIIGRGRSTGTGGTSTRGSKGQKSRSGGGVRLGFEGGQTPLFRRLPSRGFNNAKFTTRFKVVNVEILEKYFQNGEVVNYSTLVAKGILKKSETDFKILGKGRVKKALRLEVSHISSTARGAVEKVGGSVLTLGDTEL